MVATTLCGETFHTLPVLDAQTRIAEFDGDIEGYDEVVDWVLLESDAMRRWLREAPIAGRLVLAEALHEVANNCAMVGAQRCEMLARSVEIKLRQSMRFDLVPAMRAIETELDLMLGQLSHRKAI
jgi:HPt (histidine-containing phosphotransfer) domain-containing protein